MSTTKFEELLKMGNLSITKWSMKREATNAEESLCVTLRYLANGDSYLSLTSQYRIRVYTISNIVSEKTSEIWNSLCRGSLMNMTENNASWIKIAEEFERKWNFPNCLGATNRKHIKDIMIQNPANSGNLHFNFKTYFILLTVCNPDYEFTIEDNGEGGCQSDAGVFANSLLAQAVTKNKLSTPTARKVTDCDNYFSHVFIGNDAFIS